MASVPWQQAAVAAPAPPQAPYPPKFRRKQRVQVMRRDANGQPLAGYPQFGTVINPNAQEQIPDPARQWRPKIFSRSCTVRMDCQHPWERGYWQDEANLEPLTTGETQFERRRYNMNYMSHDEVALLRDVLGADMRPEAAELLKKIPKLP